MSGIITYWLIYFESNGTINNTEVEGIALLSMHGLSSPINRRMELFESCVDKDIHVLFCDENFLLDSREGLGYIKKCLEFSSQ